MYRLFIVDDEPLTRQYLRQAAPRLAPDWTVVGEAENGAEAVEKLANTPTDLLLTDVKMPIMDGLALAAWARGEKPDIQVAILSGYGEFSLAQQAIHHGVDEYLLKPVKDQDLLQLLKNSAETIKKRHAESMALKAMHTLSEDYHHQVAENYLRAILQGAQAEVGVYHPLLRQLKIDMMEAVGRIILLRVDMLSMLDSDAPLTDWHIYTYLLLVAAKEISWNLSHGRAIIVSDETVAVFLTAESALDLDGLCTKVIEQCNTFMREHFNITCNVAMGHMKTDMLEMEQSAHIAQQKLRHNILGGTEETADKAVELAEKIKHALLAEDSQALYTAVKLYFAQRKEIPSDLLYGILYLLMDGLELDHTEMQRTLKLLQKNCEFCQFTTREDCRRFLSEAFLRVDNSDSLPRKDYILQAEAFIQEHFTQPITLSQIAENLQVTPSYLSKLFHEGTGESYIKYITRLRMEYAAYLLKENPEQKIGWVADTVGYYSLKHFSYVFKEYYHQSPGQYQSNGSSNK